MPSLSSFLPTVKPGEIALDEKGGDARDSPSPGLTLAKTMNRSASAPLVIQSLRPVSTKWSPPVRGPCRQSRTRRCPSPLPTARTRPRCPRRGAGSSAASARRCPSASRALMTSVFCTSTKTPTDGSTRESASTARTAWKNVAPAPPYDLGNLDAHHAEIEQLLDELLRNLCVLVHLAAPAGESLDPRTRTHCRRTISRLPPGKKWGRAWQ